MLYDLYRRFRWFLSMCHIKYNVWLLRRRIDRELREASQKASQ